MSNGDDFSANKVVQSIQGIGKNEAIADPDTGFDRFVNFSNIVKSIFVSVLKAGFLDDVKIKKLPHLARRHTQHRSVVHRSCLLSREQPCRDFRSSKSKVISKISFQVFSRYL